MSRKELVLMVSRGFALLLITWALLGVTYLPEQVFSIYHHTGQQSVLTDTHRDYWGRYYLLGAAMHILRMIAELVAAVAFWRCGPRVERLFGEESSGEPKA